MALTAGSGSQPITLIGFQNLFIFILERDLTSLLFAKVVGTTWYGQLVSSMMGGVGVEDL